MQRYFAGVTSVKMSALETQMIAAKQQNKKEKENVLMLFFELKKILYSPGMKAMKPSVKSADVASTFSTSNQQRCQPLQFCCIKKK